MDNEKDFLLSNLINGLVKDEWDAVAGYESAIATLSDNGNLDVVAILEDIRDEEYVHIGQLESCLSLLKGDPTEHIEDGSEEGFEQLELPEEDEKVDVETESTTIGESKRTPEIDDMNIDEVKDRLKAVGFDGADFMGKSDREIRAMLKINRRARGDNYLRKWNKERQEKERPTKSEALLKDREDAEIDLDYDMPLTFSDPDDLIHSCKMGGLHRYDIIGELCDRFGVSEETAERWIDEYDNDVLIDASRVESVKEDKKSTKLSEKEMKKIICDMVTKYDASEEEVFDELQAQDQSVTKDVAHRLFKMCGVKTEEIKKEPTFDDLWEELEEMGE